MLKKRNEIVTNCDDSKKETASFTETVSHHQFILKKQGNKSLDSCSHNLYNETHSLLSRITGILS